MKNDIDFEKICSKFKFRGDLVKTIAYGDGHINDTYKVTYAEFGKHTNYILQRVNHIIFTNVEGLMENIEKVTECLSNSISQKDIEDGYEVLTLIRSKKKNQNHVEDDEGNYWRAYVFVEDATGHTFAKDNVMLYEAGRAFGKFQKKLDSFPASSLHETIKGFHNTPQRYEALLKSIGDDAIGRKSSCDEEIQFAMSRIGMVNTITGALQRGDIPLRVTHNDTKINNVLLDNETGKGRCVIDLDTVMPGSALYDYGDAIRSCGSTLAEDDENLDKLKIDYERYEAYTKGFLEAIGCSLTDKEFELLPMSAIIMTFECGIRFLTDYLDGDKYFKVHKKNHNLARAKNQFKFVKEMEDNIDKLADIVSKHREGIEKC